MKSRYKVISVVAMFLLMLLPMQSMTAEEVVVQDSISVELDEGEEIIWMNEGDSGNFVTCKTTVTYYEGGYVTIKSTSSEWRGFMRIASVTAKALVTIRFGMIDDCRDNSYYTESSHADCTSFHSDAWHDTNNAAVQCSGSFVTDLPDIIPQQQSQSSPKPLSIVRISLCPSCEPVQQEQQSQPQPLDYSFSLSAYANYWV